jgi:hypothetical protein
MCLEDNANELVLELELERERERTVGAREKCRDSSADALVYEVQWCLWK